MSIVIINGVPTEVGQGADEIDRLRELGTAERLAQAEQRIYDLTNSETGELPTALAEIERLQFALQRSEMECVCAKREAAASQAMEQQLREALGFMYDKWENGTACYEEPDEHEGFVGNAFTLDNDDENRILRLIPSCLNENKIPQDTSALEAMIAKAGEVMRERAARKVEVAFEIHPYPRWHDITNAIRALPGVTLQDMTSGILQG